MADVWDIKGMLMRRSRNGVRNSVESCWGLGFIIDVGEYYGKCRMDRDGMKGSNARDSGSVLSKLTKVVPGMFLGTFGDIKGTFGNVVGVYLW